VEEQSSISAYDSARFTIFRDYEEAQDDAYSQADIDDDNEYGGMSARERREAERQMERRDRGLTKGMYITTNILQVRSQADDDLWYIRTSCWSVSSAGLPSIVRGRPRRRGWSARWSRYPSSKETLRRA
jgi:hypothetical protein